MSLLSLLAGVPLCPTKVEDQLEIFIPSPSSLNTDPEDVKTISFGRWLVCEPLDRLDKVWAKLREAMEGKTLAAIGLKSTTGRYNPSSSGPGPVTRGVISVYTTEESVDATGYEIIDIVQHDLQYKPKTSSGLYRSRGDRKVISKQLYWNDGKPSFTSFSRKKRMTVWSEDVVDRWKKNIVHSPSEFGDSKDNNVFGCWCAECKIEDLTNLWHSMKEELESDSLGPVRMECPGSGSKRRKDRGTTSNPRLMLYTTAVNKSSVETALENTGFVVSVKYLPKVPSIDRS